MCEWVCACVCVAVCVHWECQLPNSLAALAPSPPPLQYTFSCPVCALSRSVSLSRSLFVFMKNYKSASQLKYFRLSEQQCAIENSYLAIGICPEICNGNWAIGQRGNPTTSNWTTGQLGNWWPTECGINRRPSATGRIDDIHAGHMWILCVPATSYTRCLLQLPTALAPTNISIFDCFRESNNNNSNNKKKET